MSTATRIRRAMDAVGVRSAAELARLARINEVTARSYLNGTRELSAYEPAARIAGAPSTTVEAISGCQTTEENYSSPTFTFPSDARSSKGALALQFSDDGWKIESETDSTIVFRTSKFDSGIGGILVTCGSCRQPEVELLIIAAPNGNKTTIRYDLTWIINPKSPREDRITPRGPKGKISNAVEAQIELARKRVGAAGRISSR